MDRRNVDLFDKIKKNTFLSAFLNHRVYIYCYFVVCFLLNIPVLNAYMNIISKVCFIWGALLIGWDILATHRVFKMTYWLLPVLYLVSYGISVLLNASSEFSSGCKHLVHSAIFILLIYEAHAGAPKEEIMTTIKGICKILVVLIFISSSASIGLFLENITVKINGYKVGFWENRLYGVYPSPNPGALYAVISIMASVLLMKFFDGASLVQRILCIINIAVQTIYFSLTLSKAGDLAVIVLLVSLAVTWGYPKAARKSTRGVSLLIVAAGVAVLIMGFSGLKSIIRTEMAKAPGIIVSIQTSQEQNLPTEPMPGEDNEQDDPTQEATTPPTISIERVETHGDITNSRMAIWTGCLKIMDQAPFFGFANIQTQSESALSRFDLSQLTDEEKNNFIRVNGYMHNSFVQILTFSGIVGLAVFAVLACSVVCFLGKTMYAANKDTKEYTLLAVLFSISAMLAVNGVAESHLLFNRQDPVGFLFWLFLGSAVSLAAAYHANKKKEETNSTEKFAFVAATPLQVLHCTEFVGNNLEDSAGKSDLYIVHSFQTAVKLSEGARESGLFNHVYDLKPRTFRNKLHSKLYTFYDLFFPRQSLNRKSCGTALALEKKDYSYVCASSQTTFTIGLHLAFPNAKIYLYDDGIGSYYGSMVHDYNSGLFQLMNRLFFGGALIMEPSAMYLAVPELSRSTVNCERRKLPSLPEDKLPLVEKIFDYRENAVYRRRLVYLTQPFENGREIHEKIEPEILDILGAYESDTVVRVHPRQKSADFGPLMRDPYENLWEIECLKQISADNILISYCSTAQFMPKLLKGEEPYVIFLYKIYGRTLSDALHKLIEAFAQLYSSPERILMPQSLDELRQILDQLTGLE